MHPTDLKLQIERREKLLEGRREEYMMFGRTGEDAAKDAQIMQELIYLRNELLQHPSRVEE